MTTEIDTDLFIRNIARQFEGLPPESLRMETLFRNVPGWTSLQALVVIISFDEDYGVTISAEELQRAKTIGDLYDLVMQKRGA
jgi:acyl carrier protein